MDPITKHHYDNIRNNTVIRNEDGTTSTVKTVIMGDGEREYLIPTIWDGEELSAEDAFDRAMAAETEWPSMPAGEAGVKRLEEVDLAIHEGFTDTTSPEEAEKIVLRGADYPNRGIMGTQMSPRPETRPEIKISYDDADDIERLVWAEARGEGVEGRNAVRGTVFNRLASSRFPNTVSELLTEDQFEPIRDYGDVKSIPIPKEALEQGRAEFADYYQLGEDASGGRTFFQNTETTAERGTEFSGPDPMVIGKHTFTRGYEGQEPVLDTNFSHNISVVDPEYDVASAAGFALGGLSLADATKGITTQEGRKMAKKKFQLDVSTADPDGDGNMTQMERIQAEATQKAAVESGDADLDDAGTAVGMNCGGMMLPDEDIDPVSGNPVPLGSNPENVRDDLPAMLSQDEYVLPAHVVKWHGLKHIQEMQMEAETGLMGLHMDGLIGGQEYEPEEGSEEDTIEDLAEGEELDGDDVLSEDMNVETPVVEVEDELDDLEYEDVPEESALPGMMKKQKYAFIIS